MVKADIFKIKAREILDSRGNPTVEATVILKNGLSGTASVPSGASTGIHEALELRDGQKRYQGKGVLKAVHNINSKIEVALKGFSVLKQRGLDDKLIKLDGTLNKARLGANAILAVSLACARTGSLVAKKPLYRYLAEIFGKKNKKFFLPVPSFNIINGGRHADNGLDFQEFMIMPLKVKTFKEQLRAGSEIFHSLKQLLARKNLNTAVGDEGGFAPILANNTQALQFIKQAVQDAGWKFGQQIFIALDAASSEFYSQGKYFLRNEKRKPKFTSLQLKQFWIDLSSKYPIISLEDGMAQDDWDGWKNLTEKLGKKMQLVGDDFLVTNPQRIKKAIEAGAANAVLIKLNQIGSLSETLSAISLAQKNKWKVMISHRSGETTDDFIADLAVAVGADQIKSGSLSRGERLCKYNRLLAIEQELRGK